MKHPKQKSLPNRGFLRSLLTAVVFLGLSALLLVIGFIWFHLDDIEPNSGSEPTPLVFKGADLYITMGRGSYNNGSLVLKGMNKGNAVITAPATSFNASDFPVLKYSVEGRHPGLKVAFYWVRKDNPRITHFAMLPWNGDASIAYRLRKHEDWSGRIVELGFSINGDLRGKPLVVRALSLQAFDIRTLLSVVWSEWMAFEGWKQYSINTIQGAPKDALISPVLAAAAWTGLSLLLFLLWRLYRAANWVELPLGADLRQESTLVILVALFLLPWIVLDAKWQLNLWRQHRETWQRFAGKSHGEQHLAAEDAILYQFAEELKRAVGKGFGGRIFILQDQWQDYVRLKLAYYLLPFNVYPYGNEPDVEKIGEGDLLLLLDDLEGVRYDKAAGMLRWKKGNAVRADLVLSSRIGKLLALRSNIAFLQSLEINHRWRNIPMKGRLMDDPLVFTGIPTQRGSNPGVVAVKRDYQGPTMIRFQEWDSYDGRHTEESVDVLLVSPGSHEPGKGVHWEAGQTMANGDEIMGEVFFSSEFSRVPKVFLTLQDTLASHALVPRVVSIDKRGFSFRLEGEEAADLTSASLPLGYLAVETEYEKGRLVLDGRNMDYQVLTQEVGSRWKKVGPYQVYLQEEWSRDHETQHVPEKMNFLLLERHLFGQTSSVREADPVTPRRREAPSQP